MNKFLVPNTKVRLSFDFKFVGYLFQRCYSSQFDLWANRRRVGPLTIDYLTER